MKTFALAVLILSLGTVAMRSFTHAGNTPQKSVAGSTLIDLDQLTNDDLAKLQVDLTDHDTRLSDHDIRLSAIDAKLIELQTQLSDCNKLSAATASVAAAAAKAGSAKSSSSNSGGGGSTGTATRNVYQSVAAPRPQASGGSTGSATANVYQQSSVVYSPQPTVTYQPTVTVEQPVQYTIQQSAPQQDTGFLSRTVTNTSSVASPQCYIDANGNSVCPSSVQSAQTSRTTTLSRPRLFRR